MFGFLKSNNKEELSIVEKMYAGMNPDGRSKIYYGDYKQAYAILNKINIIIKKEGKYSLEEGFNICNQLFIQVWIRKHGGLSPEFSETHYIKEMLGQKFNFISNATLMEMIDECVRIIYEKEPEIKQRDAFMEYRKTMHLENAEKNKDIELQHVNNPDYGLSPNMPVFVNGFGNDKVFLNNLLTASGEQIVYNRLGSTEVVGITGPVDIYAISKTDGTQYGTIYICNYGTTMPTTAPTGYLLNQ